MPFLPNYSEVIAILSELLRRKGDSFGRKGDNFGKLPVKEKENKNKKKEKRKKKERKNSLRCCRAHTRVREGDGFQPCGVLREKEKVARKRKRAAPVEA